MGALHSENPEDWSNVINRTWVDVRRHAANVGDRWTAEEVELQMGLWEIRLEEFSDRQVGKDAMKPNCPLLADA
jgi:hypothetical protein